MSGPDVLAGAVDARVVEVLPGVGLAWCSCEIAGDPLRRSPKALRARLRALSDRARGGRAIAQREREIPVAYRIVLHRLGREEPSPAEALTIAYLIRGGYRSRGLLPDALLVATVETEVGVWALDADRLSGPPRLALSGDGPSVADEAGTITPLFTAPGTVTGATRRLALYALTVPGVPDIAVTEALWTAYEIIDSA